MATRGARCAPRPPEVRTPDAGPIPRALPLSVGFGPQGRPLSRASRAPAVSGGVRLPRCLRVASLGL
eukprot:9474593-Pyramimonas_sp.AAC.1